MSVDARVSRPAAGADRIRPARVLAAALVGLGGGLATVRLAVHDGAGTEDTQTTSAAKEPRARAEAPLEAADTPTARPLAQDAGTREPALVGAHDAGTESASTAAGTDTLVASTQVAAPSADAGPPVARTHVASRRSVELGTVAYLRCDGLELGGGRFPCPRDRALEDAGWQVLETLGACAEDPGTGVLEVRVELTGHAVGDVRYRRVDDSAVDLAVAGRCLGPPLRALRTELSPERMIVSFRLVLR